MAVKIVSSVVAIPFSENYGDNYDRCDSSKCEPCIICGKGIKFDRLNLSIAVDIEKNHMLSAEEAKRREDAGESGDRCSYYYVGSDCARRADVRDYVQK